jgi:ABC-type bacteriocin/lantibiotic exporter with double-glycine peptidase domain
LISAGLWAALLVTPAPALRLAVPLVRQAPSRCGPAALEMVLRYYGADSTARLEAARAYDPAIGGTLITDLAAAAKRAGFAAEVATLGDSDVIALIAGGVPPILLFQNGHGPVTVRHYGVVVGWDPATAAFTLHDGGSQPRRVSRSDLRGRWRTAGSQALIVRRLGP